MEKKEGDLTQFYNKSPYTNILFKKKNNMKAPPKSRF